MKWLDAKRDRTPIENKMGSGPAADKSEPSTSERAPAVSGLKSSAEKEPDATPSAARLASESGIDLASIKGTGAGGRITTEDVRLAIDAKQNRNNSSTSVVSDVEQES